MSSVVALVPEFFSQTYGYREYLKQSVLRDLKNKYKRSALGYLWTVLNPLLMMIVLATVFSHIMRLQIKDYAAFLFCGLLPWNYFNSSAMMSLNTIRANARLFGQMPVPKYIFILSINFSNLVNFLLALIPLAIILLFSGRAIPLTAALFPLAIFPLFCVTVGVSLILATANVFFDDTLHLTEVGMSVLYFLSPIIYYREVLPPWLLKYLVFNPLFTQIETFRKIFYDGVLPDISVYCTSLIVSLLFLLFGLWIFRSAEDKFLYFV
jgi:ABC-type polysaccharide/polyol phosphate export permease